ncbi:MAG: protein kinase, partial [Deltaproteobacteria bacterium]|nr:protein kinase [Deltaproteobacteria bacterium]
MTSSILTSQESLLCRLAQTTLQESSSLTAFQTTVDQLITRGAQELTNGQAVLAMMSGSLAYRAARTSVLSLGSAGVGTSILLRPASVGLGLLGEVLSFEGVNRGLQGLGSSQVSANLWRWEGQGGWREGLLQSLITFSTLKLGGHFTQGQNWVLQQLGASTAMVAGHQAVYQLGFGERPEGDLAQQFVHAFVTNIELGLSMSLAGRFAPSLQALERSLDLSLHFSHSTNQTTTIFSERALFELSYAQNDMRQSQGISRPRPLLENIVLAMAAKETEVNIHTGLGEKVKAVIGNAPTIPEGELQAVSPSPPPVSRVVPSSSLIPAASLLHVSLGEKLGGRYEVVRHLGSGGFGDVYLVRDTNPDMGDRQLVVKIPREDRYSPDMARRVQREIRTSAKMDPRFTGIVYDSIKMQIQRPSDSVGFETVDVLIPVMEYIPGHDLLTYRMAVTRDDTVYLEQHHLSRLEQRLDLFAKICEALASVHDRGYVHNDLKPENVRIHRDGDVRLMDFGQSKLASDALQKDTDDRDSDPPPAPMTDAERENYLSGLAQNPRVRYLLEQNITQPGRVSGTPGYIAPEKFLPSTQSDRRSDIFQMGIILFELISGVHPAAQYEINLSNEGPRLIPVRDQQGYTQMGQIASFLLQANPPPPLREVMVDQTSPFLNEIDAIARRAFAAKPEERFQTIREMRQAVLMVRAKVGFDRIRQTREEMKQIEAQMHAAWDEYRMDRQIDPELEERMHAPIVELTRRRQEIDQGAESLVTVLTPFADQGNKRASKMIAELSWMRLVHGGDLLAPEVRQILMQRIRQYDVETKDEPVESMRRALDEKVEVQLRGFDLYAQDAVSDFSVLAIEYQEDSPGFYREGNVVANFDISSQNPSPIRLKAGYYIFEIHHPQYGVMRVPYHLLLKEVRQSIIDQRPTSVQIDLAPSEAIPSDFFFVNGGRATLGHDIYRFEDPGLVISRPQRQEYFDSFAVSN